LIRITTLVWLPEIVEKLVRKHNVWPDEVDDVLLRSPGPIRFAEKGKTTGDDVCIFVWDGPGMGDFSWYSLSERVVARPS
jgi:hypothetical protein